MVFVCVLWLLSGLLQINASFADETPESRAQLFGWPAKAR